MDPMPCSIHAKDDVCPDDCVVGIARRGVTSLLPLAMASEEFSVWLGQVVAACLPTSTNVCVLVEYEAALCARVGIKIKIEEIEGKSVTVVRIPFELLPLDMLRSNRCVLDKGDAVIRLDSDDVNILLRYALQRAIPLLTSGARTVGVPELPVERMICIEDRRARMRKLLGRSGGRSIEGAKSAMQVAGPSRQYFVDWQRDSARAMIMKRKVDAAALAAKLAEDFAKRGIVVGKPYDMWRETGGTDEQALMAFMPMCIRQLVDGHAKPTNTGRTMLVHALRETGFPRQSAHALFTRSIVMSGETDITGSVEIKRVFDGLWSGVKHPISCKRLVSEKLCPSSKSEQPEWCETCGTEEGAGGVGATPDMEDLATDNGLQCQFQCCDRRGVQDITRYNIPNPVAFAVRAVENGMDPVVASMRRRDARPRV